MRCRPSHYRQRYLRLAFSCCALESKPSLRSWTHCKEPQPRAPHIPSTIQPLFVLGGDNLSAFKSAMSCVMVMRHAFFQVLLEDVYH